MIRKERRREEIGNRIEGIVEMRSSVNRRVGR